MYINTKFPWQQEAVIRHNQHLLRSFQYWTGNSLVNIEGSAEKQAQHFVQGVVKLQPLLNGNL